VDSPEFGVLNHTILSNLLQMIDGQAARVLSPWEASAMDATVV
jgi:hypothetical protein